MTMAKLGVIGGSGVYHLAGAGHGEVVSLSTPFGAPSSPLQQSQIGATDVVFVARHGPGHTLSPSDLPYRANIYALKSLGVTHVLSVSAVGSLRESLPPRSLVVPNQIIDRTVRRERSFFDHGVVAHVALADPFCPDFRDTLIQSAHAVGHPVEPSGAYLCIEGPQFSTRAESHLYRSWGATVIGMTAMPEARLAREAELCYATLALVTDYDVWHETEDAVSVALVLSHLAANVDVANRIVRTVAEQGLPARTCSCRDALQHAIVTSPDRISAAQRSTLGVIADRYLSPSAEGSA
jgi:5'-methylthioadenosine phosphorylase